MKLRDKWMSSLFLFGVTVTVWIQPATTYSWMWSEAKSSGHEFVTGLLDISDSRFADEWHVVSGGNQSIDLKGMIPGDARKLEATLSKGKSDIDFMYKIVAEVRDVKGESAKEGSAKKLEKVLRMKVERDGAVVFDGLLNELTPPREGNKAWKNPTEEKFLVSESDKNYSITVYLPEKGVDASYQGLQAEVEIRLLAKQATNGAIYAE